MKLFVKRNQVKSGTKPRLASKTIQAGYKRLQIRWVNWMLKRTSKFSRRTWMLSLVVFVLSGSAYSFYKIVDAFLEDSSGSFTVTPIKKLKHSTKTGDANTSNPILLEVEYSRIKSFRQFMDSLAESPGGRNSYDSIIAGRPHLMDSVRFIEHYYQQLKQRQTWKSK